MSDRQRPQRSSDREKREGPLDPDEDGGEEAASDEQESKSGRFPGVKKGRTTGRMAAAKESDSGVKQTGKQKKVKGGKKEEEKALELEPISPFKRGMSMGVKFAALTAVVVAIFMTLLGVLTYTVAVREVDEQINQGGIDTVSTLEKSVDRVFWVKDEEAITKLLDAINVKEPQPPKVGEPEPPPGTPPYVELHKIYLQQRTVLWDSLKLQAQNGLNVRLEQLIESSGKEGGAKQIPAALVLEKAGSNQTGRAGKGLSIQQEPVGEIKGVEIFQGLATIDGAQTLVRRFDKPIVDATGTVLSGESGKAYATVFLNASKIEEVKESVQSKIILVTALGALAGVFLTALIAALLTKPVRVLEGDIAAVAGGDLEHETKPQSRDEIGALAHTFNIMTRNLRAAQQHAVDRKAIERELAIATEIQTKLLPERIPQIPGLDIHSFYLSAKEVGGDYYDFIVIDQEHLGIIVADVSGKGIPGSMVMTMARSLVRLASVRNVSPADTFKKVNRILAKDIRRGMFVTSMYMVLNVKTFVMKVASAGHNPLVVYRAETDQYELCKPQGIALGFDKGTIFDTHIQELELTLKKGDRIVAYTDGVNEAMNAESEEFGDERFYELVRANAKLSSKDCVNAIVEELKSHRGEAEQSDDITITTLAVLK